MKYVYIDTALLAIPGYAIETEAAQQLVDRVGHFAELTSPSLPVDPVISQGAEDLLWANNLGAGYDEFRQFIEVMELQRFYTPDDLLQSYQTIFDRAGVSSEVMPYEAGSTSHFSATPEFPSNLSPSDMVSETQRIMCSVGMMRSAGHSWSFGSGFVGNGLSTYSISTVIDAVRCYSGTHQSAVAFVANIPSVTNLLDLASPEAAAEIWNAAETAEDVHLSIALAAKALNPTGLLKSFKIGPEFVDDLKECEAWRDGNHASVCRTVCSQIVAGVCNRKIKPFGRPNQAIRGFDGSRGWRVHLTRGHLALRLLFWQNDEGIEFGTVGVKHELLLATGAMGAARDTEAMRLF
ncbi:hypothetical protein [Rhizobium leguminosarum]|uniref:hypothetical protein n=1 Tax=Rhizobium leguminosarum TaxID=384 RepID=UPI003F9BB094